MPKIPADLLPKASKVTYVKAQPQNRPHHCHWPGCNKTVPPAMWGCYAHWMKLPKRLRDKVWAAYRPGQEVNLTPSREYLDVADEVQRWIRENYETPICIACGDSGVATSGRSCRPCVVAGRVKE